MSSSGSSLMTGTSWWWSQPQRTSFVCGLPPRPGRSGLAGLADHGRGLGDLLAEPVEDARDLLGLVGLHGQSLGPPPQIGAHPADGLDRFDSGILAHHEPPRIVRTASMDVTWVIPPSRRGTSKPSGQ